MVCNQCPRKCNVDRTKKVGFCKAPEEFVVSRIAKHMWEEPTISGKNGSGTIFFSGCNLHCVFCQNKKISNETYGKFLTEEQLIYQMERLENEGAENINFVTPTHYSMQLIPALEKARNKVSIPFVWNSSSYELVETLRALDGLIDIYLPDCKYYSQDISLTYANARDYYEVSCHAISEMIRQTGKPIYKENGMLKRGTIVRHLVLPRCRKDSISLIRDLYSKFGKEVLLSLMWQYTPDFAMDCPYENLHRKVTTFEYNEVLKEVESLGFDGYIQKATSAKSIYTPDFTEDTF